MNKRLLIVAATTAASLCFASPKASLDAYGGFMDIKGEKTGFFHAEKIDGRWWLVTPEGNAFYGIGMSHPIAMQQQQRGNI